MAADTQCHVMEQCGGGSLLPKGSRPGMMTSGNASVPKAKSFRESSFPRPRPPFPASALSTLNDAGSIIAGIWSNAAIQMRPIDRIESLSRDSGFALGAVMSRGMLDRFDPTDGRMRKDMTVRVARLDENLGRHAGNDLEPIQVVRTSVSGTATRTTVVTHTRFLVFADIG